jgi:hypothetical protein
MEEHNQNPLQNGVPVIIISIILFAGVFISFLSAKNRTGTIILPGGITYLGPTQTPSPSPASPAVVPTKAGQIIPIDPNTGWNTYTGKVFPYTFSYPASLSLGWFPNDPYDGVTIFYGNTDSQSNLFVRIEKLTSSPREHATTWWKQYNWKGVKNVIEFTNSKGLKGFRATYISTDGTTPYDHVFFAVPDRKDLIVWISGKLFTKDVFDTLIDSVEWKK